MPLPSQRTYTLPAPDPKPICSECVVTWLLLGDGGVCLHCQQPVIWTGREEATDAR